ncbi:MAG: DUF2807 domain-containing protein [Caulobacterales bacterium]|nr:DUF2807 domain-containing protein [Caulobacterales bacterium]
MKLHLLLAASAALLSATLLGEGAAQAASVEMRDAVLRVTIVPEDRADVKVDVVRSNPKLPLDIRTRGDRTVIDGGLAFRIHDCHGSGADRRVSVRGVGDVAWDAMPEVVIHTPRAVAAESSGAVFGSIGRSASLDLEESGCSGWTIANVDGAAAVHESGASTVKMGSAGRLDTRISGAGKLYATELKGLDVIVSGAGLVRVTQLTGSLDAKVSGTGHIDVLDGRVGPMHASVSGIGSVEFGGEADSLDASISGMGSIRVKAVKGPVTKAVSGAGHVSVG